MHENGYGQNVGVFCAAASHGDFPYMMWLHMNRCLWAVHTFKEAFKNENLENIK